ncbi:F0F1 ATP synthase subunit B/delta [Gordonia sp. ABSL1-1]|uniref:F0F1 ATP synthase subunit B/delta n=1 Tax=Gordonia sp. ABSL1-1 TaxID=3053923 RepID=UPI002573990C|nr:F0F1 ATP synthase subunit B/delta [Gordonia sp. ABSL1-1]MDL9937028.1 F0F1 ATP synthase subunit B/delta [Gordonia sp. ABSL1-1]
MDILIGNLVGFAVIAFLFWKFLLPPLSKAVKNTQDTIDRQVVESEEAGARLIDAKAAHEKAIANAKAEAAELHESALSDAEAIRSDLKVAADAEVKRISEHGKNQVDLTRTSLVRALRTDLGLSAVDGAGKLVREHLADPAAQSASVDRVIDELQSMASSTGSDSVSSSELVGLHSLRAGSRDAAVAVAREFDNAATGLDEAALTSAADELTQVIEFLNENAVLRKRLTEDEDNPTAKETLVRNLFGGKVAPIVVDVVAAGAKQRWSTSADFLVGLRRQNSLIVLTAAERAGVIEQTEDELFRVSRLLDGYPELASLLSDHTHNADKRVALLQKLVGEQVGKYTWSLLSNTVRLLHGQPSELAVGHLAELAAARRGESVAHVVSAAPLTEAQIQRLSGVLGTIYGRTISVQTEVRTELLGGLRIAVGEEVIDADIATRLAKAAESLPR